MDSNTKIPTKTLQWEPNEEFTISGFELETTINLLNIRLNTPEAQVIIREYETLRKLTDVVRKGVEEGKVKESETSND